MKSDNFTTKHKAVIIKASMGNTNKKVARIEFDRKYEDDVIRRLNKGGFEVELRCASW